MDKTLLQRPGEQAEPSPNGDPAVPITTSRIPQPEPGTATIREMQVEVPKPPLHITLVPPVDYDGQRYSELTLDFDSMIGNDFHRAEREFTHTYRADKDEMPLPEMKHLYHNIIAAHLANVPVGLIKKLPRRYYVPLRQECLKACGSSPDEEKA
jgi:hypothetical protein